jgi:hypothetical protein
MNGQVMILSGFAKSTSWKVKSLTVLEHSLCSSTRRTPVKRVHTSSNTVCPSLRKKGCEREREREREDVVLEQETTFWIPSSLSPQHKSYS